jgi:NAD(P)-dependent dehydrogenase (short-subunit alcohol dehydrogenase family)/acyl carrier protein
VLAQALSGESSVDGIVCLFSSDLPLDSELPATAITQTAQAACTTVLDIVHELQTGRSAPAPRLWLVTENCVSINGSQLSGVAHAPVRGLALAIAQEHPELRCVNVDVDGVSSQPTLQALCDELVADSPEDRIAFRNGVRSVLRLTPCRAGSDSTSPRLSSHATYLITGGLGVLGLVFAQWLAERGARHLALVGRRPPDAAASAALDRLRALGAQLHISQVDVADFAQVSGLFKRLAAEAPPVAGIIHAAGVIDGGILRDQTWERFAPVFAPKVAGAWNLHLATRELPVSFFAMISSTAAVLGHAGIANYAAANAFLDSLAHARRARGLPALTINLGSWAGFGLISSAVVESLVREGIRPVAREQLLAAFSRALVADETQVVVAQVNWQEFEKFRGQQPLTEQVRATRTVQDAGGAFITRLDAAARESRLEMLADYVRAEVANVAGIDDVARLASDRGFFEQGMDSLGSIELRNRLQRGLGRALPATLAFDYPNVDAVVAYLRREIFGDAYFAESRSSEPPHSSASAAADQAHGDEDIEAAIAQELAQLDSLLRPHR